MTPKHTLAFGVLLVSHNESEDIFSFFLSLSFFLSYLFVCLFVWLRWVFVAARGLSLNCGERGLLFVAVCRLLIAVASLVVEHRP